ncbi:hypothetical protein MMON_04990 [Mycolicibacterium monacense]|uniref:Uncharacterized protein n=1 Tax=Mycolicibacterium monacense TaxID=85693 RepID=A0AAD1MV67_MYCMB|nr:hypothetical protein MMON_04990 [Mycolicibacterium monacense]
MVAVLLDDPRTGLAELLRQAVLPHPGVFNQVVVDGDDLVMILKWHGNSQFLTASLSF